MAICMTSYEKMPFVVCDKCGESTGVYLFGWKVCKQDAEKRGWSFEENPDNGNYLCACPDCRMAESEGEGNE